MVGKSVLNKVADAASVQAFSHGGAAAWQLTVSDVEQLLALGDRLMDNLLGLLHAHMNGRVGADPNVTADRTLLPEQHSIIDAALPIWTAKESRCVKN